jgi:hypothetical protein
MTKRIDWNKILTQIKELNEVLINQNFCIDLAYRFHLSMKPHLLQSPTINTRSISAYWSREFFEHNLLNNYKLDAYDIFIETNYYSYLNLVEFRDNAYKLGEQIYVVDLISESTDVKYGMEIDDWFDDNDHFQATMQDLWNNDIVNLWISESKLMSRKNTTNFSHYWKSEDYIYQMRVYDSTGKPKLVILLGTYLDYT